MKKYLIILVLLFITSAGFVAYKSAPSFNQIYVAKNNPAEVEKVEIKNEPKTLSVIEEKPASTTLKIVPEIEIAPAEIIQGEPIMISISNTILDDISKIYFDDKSIWFWNFENRPSALYPIDLNQKIGDYKIVVNLANGQTIEKTVTILPREKVEEPLGIPAKLGGNTPEAATNLVTNLTKENVILNSIYSASKKFWSEKFIYPIANPIVTDAYGYLRKTGYYTIPHKGADFHANEGTLVIAMNRGVVRLARESTIYGKNIAIDHGFGVVTLYMHLSKINVTVGQLVEQGDIIGLSGQTGYAEVPHLHLSVKIDGISIDPITFLKLFK